MPLAPDHSWYVDLGPAREGNLRPAMEARLRNKASPASGVDALEVWPKILFLGMRGSGKSTELNSLAASVRDAFEVVKFDLDARVNSADFDLSEMVLTIAVEVERHFRENLRQPLPEALLADIQRWFATVTHENVKERIAAVEVSAGAKMPGAAAFFGSVMGLLKSSNAEREKLVAELRRFPGDLVQLTNRLLDAAAKVVGDQREILIVVDNLDRYDPEIVDRALGGGSDHLLALHASMILTPPVDLLIRPRGQPLQNVYAHEVMHVPAIRKADDALDMLRDPGADLMRTVLAKRLDTGALMAEGVVDALVRLSGGHPRLLLELTREALLRDTAGGRLTQAGVDAAVRAQLTVLRDQINHSGLVKQIADVYASHQLGPEPEYLTLLFRRWIFKHDGQDWYAVNPLVLRVPEVMEAIAPGQKV